MKTVLLVVALGAALAAVLFVVGALLLDVATERVKRTNVYRDWQRGRALRLASALNDRPLVLSGTSVSLDWPRPRPTLRLVK
jgi:hypothetical protein